MVLTREICYYLAKNYTSKGEFQKKNKAVYETAKRNGWLDEFFQTYLQESYRAIERTIDEESAFIRIAHIMA